MVDDRRPVSDLSVGECLGGALGVAHLVTPQLLALLGIALGVLLRQALAEPPPGFQQVLVLTAAVLGFYHHAGGQVHQTDGGGCFVAVLPAWTRPLVWLDRQVAVVQLRLSSSRLGQHRHGGG